MVYKTSRCSLIYSFISFEDYTDSSKENKKERVLHIYNAVAEV
jgi:hypothetical protein